jgi:aldehyde dehydrogenase (NAD+)
MYEQWHPLGIVGIISAFNFPVAVWSWNSMLALVCGDVCIWKPSEKTPLCGIACQHIISEVFAKNNVPEGVCSLIIGGRNVGEWMANDTRIPLLSATGSTKMGKAVGAAVGARLGRALLELGGNNAIIISKDADIDMAIRGALFGAVGTAGQRCTSTRRLIIHNDVYEKVKQKLVASYSQLRIGNPLDENNHVGPLIDKDAVKMYEASIEECKKEGGKFIVEGGILSGDGFESGCYVKPCIAEVEPHYKIVEQETFAPILYLMKYNTLDEAIAIQNGVPQGLSSSIMTLNLREAEQFLSATGSDCGIANVNIGTSGAEIGGAFRTCGVINTHTKGCIDNECSAARDDHAHTRAQNNVIRAINGREAGIGIKAQVSRIAIGFLAQAVGGDKAVDHHTERGRPGDIMETGCDRDTRARKAAAADGRKGDGVHLH